MEKYSKLHPELLPHLSIKSAYSSNNSPRHPSFQVTDSIYAKEHLNFVTRLSTPIESPPIIRLRVPGTPSIKYVSPQEKLFEKEDIYINPTALYLSRKPLAYKRTIKKNSIVPERTFSFTPVENSRKRPSKKKPNFFNRSITISQDSGPLQELKDQHNKKPHKILHQQALSLLNKACEDMEDFPKISPKVDKAKKILEQYMKNFERTTLTLKNYSGMESEVMNQLYILSEDSRNELNKDMAITADEIRKGTMDPALRSKKRKIIQL